MKSPKVFRLPFQYVRPIPSPSFKSHNRRMDTSTLDKLETARELDDLNDQVKNLRLQLDFQLLQNRTLRVRVNRYEAIIGMEAAA